MTCASVPGDGVVRRRLPNFCLSRTRPEEAWDKFSEKSCPAAFGCATFGVAMFELQQHAGRPTRTHDQINLPMCHISIQVYFMCMCAYIQSHALSDAH